MNIKLELYYFAPSHMHHRTTHNPAILFKKAELAITPAVLGAIWRGYILIDGHNWKIKGHDERTNTFKLLGYLDSCSEDYLRCLVAGGWHIIAEGANYYDFARFLLITQKIFRFRS